MPAPLSEELTKAARKIWDIAPCSGVYEVQNQRNGKRYIGSAVNIRDRWAVHLSTLRQNAHHNSHLQYAFDKYGEEAFMFSVLEHIEDTSQLIAREQYYLNVLKPEYNIAMVAGSKLGVHPTKETRRKMSEAKKGKRNPNYGKHLSAQTKQKLSLAMSGEQSFFYGKHLSPEHRAKIGKRNEGKHPSKRARRRMSESRRGEQNHFYGKHHNSESRKKISEALKGNQNSRGRILSQETRRKMSIAQKVRRRRECIARDREEGLSDRIE